MSTAEQDDLEPSEASLDDEKYTELLKQLAEKQKPQKKLSEEEVLSALLESYTEDQLTPEEQALGFDPKVTAADLAEWMAQYIETHDQLSHKTAVSFVDMRSDGRFTYINENNHPAISPEVLDVFKALTLDTVVWVDKIKTKYWRKREPGDPPGRKA